MFPEVPLRGVGKDIKVIIYLNEDAFLVNRHDYFLKVWESKGDWIQVAEWIEANGIYVSATHNSVCHLPFS